MFLECSFVCPVWSSTHINSGHDRQQVVKLEEVCVFQRVKVLVDLGSDDAKRVLGTEVEAAAKPLKDDVRHVVGRVVSDHVCGFAQ